MKLKKKRYIIYFFNNYSYNINFLNFLYFYYYVFLISFFFKYFYYYIFLKKLILRNFNFRKNYYKSKIYHNFKIRNVFLYLKDNFFLSLGCMGRSLLKKIKNYIFLKFLRFFLYKISLLLNNLSDLLYLNVSKKILISFNSYKYYFNKYNRKIFKIIYYKINSVLIYEKKIFGYMRLKKYPRRKKFLTKRSVRKMLLKNYLPRINSMRNKTLLKLQSYIKFKRLIIRLKKNNGKNISGRITVRYKGGGKFYLYRKIDFSNTKYNTKYKCLGFDRSRYSSALLGLLKSDINIYKYTILPDNFKLENNIFTTFDYKNLSINLGCTIPIGWIPNNTLIYNLEVYPECNSKLIRSAGTCGKIISHTNNNVHIKLPSGTIKKFSKYCLANIGRVSNMFHNFQNYGKAGYNRVFNKRPRVNGEKMNAVDHPNGGRTKRGKPLKNYWGKIIK